MIIAMNPGVGTRLAARVRRATLDRALSEGADPARSALIAARAAQLTSVSSRARVARGLESLALTAERPPSRVRVLPARAAIDANRAELLEIAGTLRDREPVYAQGVATLELLLRDGTGPAYTDRRGEAVARALELARDRLSGTAVLTGQR